MQSEHSSNIDQVLRAVLVETLGLPQARVAGFDAETGLFGALPELDSMAVAEFLTEIEDRLGVVIEDDEVDGDMLASFGSLSAYLARKLG
ncbi:acyl carrier protein [Sphingomonas changnyeongensis]|uniref:Acyl carrier protein n=1 Tax=Sphingomonas changnyeongensis TaxID=2698679 RepID=A0A7Z2S5G0_9SPHN|nr:acyl carrier protein [Sphingomonas changnyeongensis]QHL91080.1 acyl carrier protein [Sphingomonas changnyeongensis]